MNPAPSSYSGARRTRPRHDTSSRHKESLHACTSAPHDTLQSQEELERIIASHRDTPGALIPILQEVQQLYGYLPATALRRISRATGISYSEVAGVVTFYSYFTTVPRGEHTCRVCLGTACYVRGGKEVLAAFREELGIDVGNTTEDRRFSLEIGRCFGACGLAPVVMVDDDVHQRVNPTCVREILAEYAPEVSS